MAQEFLSSLRRLGNRGFQNSFWFEFCFIVNWTEFVERLGLNRFSHELQELLPVLVESVQ